MEDTNEFSHVKSYTTLLWIAGFFMLVAAVLMHTMAQKEENEAWVFEMVRNIELVMALACFTVATLRSLGSRAAGTATAALSIVLALWVPFGTAIFFWWVFRVRERENSEPEVT